MGLPYYRRADYLPTIHHLATASDSILAPASSPGPTKPTETGIMPILGQQSVHLKQPSPPSPPGFRRSWKRILDLDLDPRKPARGPWAMTICFFCVCRCFQIPLLFPLFPSSSFFSFPMEIPDKSNAARRSAAVGASKRATQRDATRLKQTSAALGSYHLFFKHTKFYIPLGSGGSNRNRKHRVAFRRDWI